MKKWLTCSVWNYMLTFPFIPATLCRFLHEQAPISAPRGENNMRARKKNNNAIIHHSITCYVLVPGCIFFCWGTVCAQVKPIKKILPCRDVSYEIERKKNLFSSFPIQWLVEPGIYFTREPGQKRKRLYCFSARDSILGDPRGEIWIGSFSKKNYKHLDVVRVKRCF